MEKKDPVVTVNEEPASSETATRQINQGGEEATRETGKREEPDQVSRKPERRQGSGNN